MPDAGALSMAAARPQGTPARTQAGTRLGLFGKLPAHGDFIRRGSLPASFCAPWDAWLQEGIAAARAAIGEARWESVWDAAPAWRFALPPGACGPDAAAGVLLPSRDAVGRRFPLTLAAVRDAGEDAPWPAAWFARLEGAGRAALAAGQDADALAALLPAPEAEPAGADAAPALDAAGPAAAAEDPLAAFWQRVDAARLATGEEPPGAAPGATADPMPGDAAAAAERPGDTLPGAAASPPEEAIPPAPPPAEAMVEPGWWTAAADDGTPGLVWPLPALPGAAEFVLLLESEA